MEIRFGAQKAGAPFSAGDVNRHERPDIKTDPVVDIRLPADRLLGEGLPADKDIVRLLPFKDGLEVPLQFDGRSQPVFGSAFTALDAVALASDPVTEVAVGQGLQEPASFAAIAASL